MRFASRTARYVLELTNARSTRVNARRVATSVCETRRFATRRRRNSALMQGPSNLPALLWAALGELDQAHANNGAGTSGVPSLREWANLIRVLDERGIAQSKLPFLLRLSIRAVRSGVTNASRKGWVGEAFVSRLPLELSHYPAGYGMADERITRHARFGSRVDFASAGGVRHRIRREVESGAVFKRGRAQSGFGPRPLGEGTRLSGRRSRSQTPRLSTIDDFGEGPRHALDYFRS